MIYLDYNATTPLHPEVSQAMLPYLVDNNLFGNPSSSHSLGVQARKAVEDARKQVAQFLHCHTDEITFTSCGSESNNYAIKGLVLQQLQEQQQQNTILRNHIVTCKTEHVAVIEVCKYLEKHHNVTVTYLDVNHEGIVDLEQLKESLSSKTLLVTIMHANNETGTLQPIVQIGKILDEFEQQTGNRIFFHTDASQSVAKVPFKLYMNLENHSVQFGSLQPDDFSRVDLLTVCPHKFYGPKGVAALFIRRATTYGKLLKQIHGANHEQNLRAGTENVLLIVGLGKACEVAGKELSQRIDHMKLTRDRLYQNLINNLGGESFVKVNGPKDASKQLPNTLNVSFVGVESNTLLDEIGDRVAASAGAACHSGDDYVVSYVLEAMKIPLNTALGALRLSTGRLLTSNNIDQASEIICEAVKRLRPSTTEEDINNIIEEEICLVEKSYDGRSMKLTSMTHGLGCGCKIRPQVLERILQNIPKNFDPNVLVGTETSDDAGVYKLTDDLAMVNTIDFFTPMVDSARDFGAIASANALSDVYAMGGKALTAMNVVGFPVRRLPIEVLQEIIHGAQLKCQEAGVSVVGGHSIEDNEMFFGQSVTGIVHPNKIWRNNGSQIGDVLFLSKPIGVGIIATAMKRGMIKSDSETACSAIKSMSLLNKYAADILRDNNYTVTACTDVTGFGLLGHLKEMVQANRDISVVIQASDVPVIDGVFDLAMISNLIPGGTLNNIQFVKNIVEYGAQVSEITKTVLCDAQTSGGLLFSVPADEAEKVMKEFEEKNIFVNRVGYFQKNVNNSSTQIHVI
jgi:cysteine desulfurase